jgi:hypothetical protein
LNIELTATSTKKLSLSRWVSVVHVEELSARWKRGLAALAHKLVLGPSCEIRYLVLRHSVLRADKQTSKILEDERVKIFET